MHSTTLRGIFPDPKPVYRRNFIKENVKSIKQMQGILQEAGVIQPKKKSVLDRYRNLPRIAKSRESNTTRSLGNITRTNISTADSKLATKATNVANLKSQAPKDTRVGPTRKRNIINTSAHAVEGDSRLTHRAMQTEREEDLSRLYDTGVIKYPSPGILRSPRKSEISPNGPLQNGQGDEIDSASRMVENLTIEDKDFIKENMNIKTKPSKQSPIKVMAQAPPNYQRGVVPKYIRDRKEDVPAEPPDADCPPGHILLPEEERKETLRVLRQSYADRIQELNMMPVRNDTLKMRKRKMEIEEELKRIDGGIKVFQRPKVFVKINA